MLLRGRQWKRDPVCGRAGGSAEVHPTDGFGSRLSADSAPAAGLTTQELAGRIEPAGNTALAGALMTARPRPGLPMRSGAGEAISFFF
jgi:hypothetical protein